MSDCRKSLVCDLVYISIILGSKSVLVFQHPIRHIVMMIDNLIFSYPSQCRHNVMLLIILWFL